MKKAEDKRPVMGGQAVLEGVMMRGPDRTALAVRLPDKKIQVKVTPYQPPVKKNKWFGIPFIRGVMNLVDSLKTGYETIGYSADLLGETEEPPTRFEKWLAKVTGRKVEEILMPVAMVLGILLAVGLFFILPSLAASLLKTWISSRVAVNLLEGVIRLLIFLVYILSVRAVPDIQRVFRYHGAEHKTVYCHERGEELIPENARRFSRLHPRCGTSFLLLVMLISILLFSLLGWDRNWLTRIVSRLLLLPVVAGVSYEVLRFLANHDNFIFRILRAPGLWTQYLTTAEPDDGMLTVAIAAMKAALPEGEVRDLTMVLNADGTVPVDREDTETEDPEEPDGDGQETEC